MGNYGRYNAWSYITRGIRLFNGRWCNVSDVSVNIIYLMQDICWVSIRCLCWLYIKLLTHVMWYTRRLSATYLRTTFLYGSLWESKLLNGDFSGIGLVNVLKFSLVPFEDLLELLEALISNRFQLLSKRSPFPLPELINITQSSENSERISK